MNAKEFSKRRRQLLRMIGKNGIAVVPAAPVRYRNRDVEYPYRQDSDFYYLTGFDEPESVAVLAPGRAHGEYVLFCRERDPERETWDGYRVGPERASEMLGADDAFPINDIDEILPGLMENCERVYYSMGVHPEFDARVLGWLNALRAKGAAVHPPQEFVSLDHYLHDMRLYKSRAEISAMRKAARIAVGAHKRAMKLCAPGMTEYQIEGEYLHEFRRNGVVPSYPPIVGAGAHSCILHYNENSAPLVEGDLLLVDAGCEYELYASDVTRTFPVSGRFSKAQRVIYDIVREAHDAAVDKVRPGNHWNEPHDAAVKVITRGLVRVGLLRGSVARLVKSGAYRRFFMHRTGHWLGMDVHDVGDYKVGEEWRILEPGMVLTVEPGIYIPAGSSRVARKWWNIGVRIEDDVLVTREGPEVLTRALPIDAAEIERLMAGV